MSRASYRTVAGAASVELVVSQSRFRCAIERVESEIEVRAIVNAVRRGSWDATHHCSAYVIGPEGALERSSDGGEPSGTAGSPILGVIRGLDLTDVVAVVSRWFGGTPLGTGGLSHAYADVTRAAIEEAGIRERVLQELHTVSIDHAHVGRLQHALRARGATVLGTEYADQAELRLAIPPRARAVAEELVAELTEGEATLRHVGEQWVDL